MRTRLSTVLARRALIAATKRLRLAVAGLAPPVHSLAQVAASKDPRLICRSLRPLDCETPVALLDEFLTPESVFFVRNHMLVPNVEQRTWTLSIDGEVASPATMSLDELRRMPSTSVTATIECAGNGRAFFDPPVEGIQWRRGAVGTARWTGVRLGDLLRHAAVRDTATHVWLSADDRPLGSQPPFVRQLAVAKALDPDTLVAYAMNDRPLSLLHGAPARAIVPGWEGAYSVKWLKQLTVATHEHDGFWIVSDYRYPTRRVLPGAPVDECDMAPLARLAIKSLITRPLDGARIAPGPVTVAGFAWAGDTDIACVDVSIDGGGSWRPARLVGERIKYSWRRFECDVEFTRREVYTVLSRATDCQGRTQPIVPAWNPSGYLWNGPDVIRVEAGS